MLQWVPLYLASLALVSYLPRLVWLSVEPGVLAVFGRGTSKWSPLETILHLMLFYRCVEDQDEKLERLVGFYFRTVHNK